MYVSHFHYPYDPRDGGCGELWWGMDTLLPVLAELILKCNIESKTIRFSTPPPTLEPSNW